MPNMIPAIRQSRRRSSCLDADGGVGGVSIIASCGNCDRGLVNVPVPYVVNARRTPPSCFNIFAFTEGD
jgi:hypothetical protein